MIRHRGIDFYICGWEPNAPDRCEMCNELADDLRPFGRDGQWVCYNCSIIDQHQTVKRCERLMSKSDMIITSGKFNSKSTETEVRNYLEGLYASKPDHFDDGTFH